MPAPFAREPKLTLVAPVMVPLLTRSAPLRSRELPATLSVPPGVIVMREPPVLARGPPVLITEPPLLISIAPSFSKAVVFTSDWDPTISRPAPLLKPPFHARG